MAQHRMLTLSDNGTYIVGKYVEDKKDLKKGKTYIFITKDGIVYKRYSKQKYEGTKN